MTVGLTTGCHDKSVGPGVKTEPVTTIQNNKFTLQENLQLFYG